MSRPDLPEALPHPVVDNHCHLDISRGADEPALPVTEALALAARVGVERVVQIGCDLDGARWAVATAEAHPAVVAGVALHPNEAPRLAAAGLLDDALAEIERLAGSSDRVRAVGETGLDHYRTGPEGREAQEASFRAHVDLAKRLDKTLVIHDRDAHDDVLRVLDEVGAPPRWVMHCFSGDEAFARACVERGAHLSFAGTVTFKNAQIVAGRAAGDSAGPAAGGDRRAVPHPDAAPGPGQRLLPGPTHRARHGRHSRPRPGRAVPGDRCQHRHGLRRALG